MASHAGGGPRARVQRNGGVSIRHRLRGQLDDAAIDRFPEALVRFSALSGGGWLALSPRSERSGRRRRGLRLGTWERSGPACAFTSTGSNGSPPLPRGTGSADRVSRARCRQPGRPGCSHANPQAGRGASIGTKARAPEGTGVTTKVASHGPGRGRRRGGSALAQ